MRIEPIKPVYPMVNPPRYRNAAMAIRHNEHAVVDRITGQRTYLPMKEAWELFNKLNSVDIVV